MMTLSQLFARNPTSRRVVAKTPQKGNPVAMRRMGEALPETVLLPRKGHGHHPHLHLVTHPDVFDWGSVSPGEMRASLIPRSHAGAKQIAVTVGGATVGTLESLPAALLYDWVQKHNSRGYDIQADIYNPGNKAQPQLLTKSASSIAHYLHTLPAH